MLGHQPSTNSKQEMVGLRTAYHQAVASSGAPWSLITFHPPLRVPPGMGLRCDAETCPRLSSLSTVYLCGPLRPANSCLTPLIRAFPLPVWYVQAAAGSVNSMRHTGHRKMSFPTLFRGQAQPSTPALGQRGEEEWDVVEPSEAYVVGRVSLPPPPSSPEDVEHWTRAHW